MCSAPVCFAGESGRCEKRPRGQSDPPSWPLVPSPPSRPFSSRPYASGTIEQNVLSFLLSSPLLRTH